MMKSAIFANAISQRCKIKFLYSFQEVIIDPYFTAIDKNGKKVIYGKSSASNEIKKYEYDRISNIKLLSYQRFSPIIPIINEAS
jgi:hypothetical protein